MNAPVPIPRLNNLISNETIRRKFEEVLGKRAPAFISSVVSAVSSNKALMNAEPMSVISSAMIAATLDLPINPSLGFAYIVPFKGIAQFQIGYKGLIQLAMRSGQFATMNVSRVFEGQIVDQDPFTGWMKFDAKKKVSETIVGYVFYFRLINGFEKYVFMSKEECEVHAKRYSQTYQRNIGRWVEDFDAMAMKTVIKRGLSKWAPLSIEMQRAIELDGAVVSEDGTPREYPDNPENAETVEGEETTKEEGPTRLKKMLEGKDAQPTVGSDEDIANAAKETT